MNMVKVQTTKDSQPTHSKVVGHPIVDGLSFSATWAVFYSVCALLYAVAPAAVTTATSQLFHGMSFSQMEQTGAPFGFRDFISVLVIGAVYTFVAGVTWSFTHSYLLRISGERQMDRARNFTAQRAELKPQP